MKLGTVGKTETSGREEEERVYNSNQQGVILRCACEMVMEVERWAGVRDVGREDVGNRHEQAVAFRYYLLVLIVKK
jgi:hypothetical protein